MRDCNGIEYISCYCLLVMSSSEWIFVVLSSQEYAVINLAVSLDSQHFKQRHIVELPINYLTR